eukprot:5145100-Pyramimonas_sp.AAC.1
MLARSIPQLPLRCQRARGNIGWDGVARNGKPRETRLATTVPLGVATIFKPVAEPANPVPP